MYDDDSCKKACGQGCRTCRVPDGSNCQVSTEAALEAAKRAGMSKLRSPTCWDVLQAYLLCYVQCGEEAQARMHAWLLIPE